MKNKKRYSSMLKSFDSVLGPIIDWTVECHKENITPGDLIVPGGRWTYISDTPPRSIPRNRG